MSVHENMDRESLRTISQPADARHQIDARVTRYNVVRLRVAQCLVPLAAIVNVMIRRAPDLMPVGIGFAIMFGVLVVLVSAIGHLGWQSLMPQHQGLLLTATGIRIASTDIRRWTYRKGTARLYGARVSFRLRARKGDESVLEGTLRRLFGPPSELARRGSPRARGLAATVALFGLVLTIVALSRDNVLLALVGLPAFVLGLSAAGTLSSRVVRR